jgi:hypothetical protein
MGGNNRRTWLDGDTLVQAVALYVLLMLFLGFFPFTLPEGPIIAFINVFSGGPDVWGLQTYGFSSWETKFFANAVMLLLLVPTANGLLVRWLTRIHLFLAGRRFIHRRLLLYAALPSVFLLLFFFASEKSLGATGVFEQMLSDGLLFVGSNPLSTYLNYVLYGFARDSGVDFLVQLASAPWAFIRAVSNLSGFFFILFAAYAAAHLFKDAGKQATFFAYLAAQGYMFLFFYDHDTHPQEVALLVLFAYYAIKYIRSEASIFPSAVFFSLSALMHMATFVFLPSLIALPFLRRRQVGGLGTADHGSQPTLLAFFDSILSKESLKMVVGLVVPILLFVHLVVVPNSGRFYGGAYGDLIGGGDGRMFLPLVNAQTDYEKYTMFSYENLFEKLNVMLFLAPMTLLLGFVFAAKYWREFFSDGVRSFLLINFILGAVFIFMWCADYGAILDWNLFSPAAFMMSLLVAFFLAEKKDEPYGSYIAVSAIAYSLLHLSSMVF